jgi:hypothetical protein
MKRTGWYKPTQVPAREGWYERDHRQCDYPGRRERVISLDQWTPVPIGDSLYPGVWYVRSGPAYLWKNPITGESKMLDNINDASHQYLPWRGVAN